MATFHQRSQTTRSALQFLNDTGTRGLQVPLEVQKLRESALKPYGSVWERDSKPTEDLAIRLKPWSPGATVKKPVLSLTPAKDTRIAQPSPNTIERLKTWREKYGRDQRLLKHTENTSHDAARNSGQQSNKRGRTHPYQRTFHPPATPKPWSCN